MSEIDAVTRLDVLTDEDFQIQASFRYLIRRFVRYSEEQARAAGITPQQHMMLLTIRGHPAFPLVTIKDIAERLQLRHHSTSLLVDRGVKRGLLRRMGDTVDRRRVHVLLTDEGVAMLERITEANRKELRASNTQLLDMHRSLMRAIGDEPPAAEGSGQE